MLFMLVKSYHKKKKKMFKTDLMTTFILLLIVGERLTGTSYQRNSWNSKVTHASLSESKR